MRTRILISGGGPSAHLVCHENCLRPSVDELRARVQRNIEPLGVDGVDLGRLYLGGPLTAELRSSGNCYDSLRQMQRGESCELQCGILSYMLTCEPYIGSVRRTSSAPNSDALPRAQVSLLSQKQPAP